MGDTVLSEVSAEQSYCITVLLRSFASRGVGIWVDAWRSIRMIQLEQVRGFGVRVEHVEAEVSEILLRFQLR
jgi:hypothetical protein